MKKVLIIQESLGGGGAEKVLIDILNGIDYSRYQIDLAIISNNDIYSDKINNNVNVRNFFPHFNFKNKLLKKIYLQFKIWHIKKAHLYVPYFLSKDYDIEIAFLEGPSTRILSKSKNRKSKKVAWVHTDLTKLRRLDRASEERAYEKIDKIICVSNDSKKSFEKLYRNLIDKTEVIYNLIDVKNVLDLGNKEVDLIFEKNTLIGVGRLNIQKRFDKLIKAHKLLLDEGIENNLLILGEGDERENLKRLIEELDVKSTVRLLGFKENPYQYIKNSDIYVMSSDVEGFSLTVAEALILGKAVVATNCAGPVEILENGKYGVLVNGDSVEDLMISLKKVLSDDAKKNYYEKMAKERSGIFNENIFWEKFYNIIG